MLGKALRIGIALLVAAVVYLLSQSQTVQVVVAARDLAPGQAISEGDVTLQAMPENLAPEDALTSIESVLGQTLAVPRSAGDVIRQAHLGPWQFDLEPNERAMAIQVNDASGVAGVLKPGDKVGVVALIDDQTFVQAILARFPVEEAGETQTPLVSGDYAKVVIEGLRVLYVSPDFQALHETGSEDPLLGSIGSMKAKEGAVVVAVPAEPVNVVYEFQTFGAENVTMPVNPVELLAALQMSDGARLSLFLVPPNAEVSIRTSGFFVPAMVVFPQPSEQAEESK